MIKLLILPFTILFSHSIIASEKVECFIENYHILVDVPSGWQYINDSKELDKFGQFNMLIYMHEVPDTTHLGFNENIGIQYYKLERENSSLNNFQEFVVAEHSKYFPDLINKDKGYCTIDSSLSIWAVFDVESDSSCYTFLQFYLVRGSIGFVISCVSNCLEFEGHKKQFEIVAASARFFEK